MELPYRRFAMTLFHDTRVAYNTGPSYRGLSPDHYVAPACILSARLDDIPSAISLVWPPGPRLAFDSSPSAPVFASTCLPTPPDRARNCNRCFSPSASRFFCRLDSAELGPDSCAAVSTAASPRSAPLRLLLPQQRVLDAQAGRRLIDALLLLTTAISCATLAFREN